jgi:hypothetical protein
LSMQLRIHGAQKKITRRVIAVAPCKQEPGDLGIGLVWRHAGRSSP